MTQTLYRKRANLTMKVASVVLAGILFVYQVSFEVTRYVSHFTTTSVSLKRPPTLEFPQVVLCPQQPFNLHALKDLGLDITAPPQGVDSREHIHQNILELKGVNRSMSATEVWEEAAFALGDIVENFRFGDIMENYTEESQSSQYWRRVLTPFGHCFALDLPQVNNQDTDLPNISVTLKMYPYKSRCPTAEKLCDFHNITVIEKCNTTCALEDYFGERIIYNVLVSRNYSTDSKRILFDASSPELWQFAILSRPENPLNILRIDSSPVEIHPISCSSTRLKGPGFSFGGCFQKRMQSEYACLPVYNNTKVTVGEACKVQTLFEAIQSSENKSCNDPAPHQCPYKQWTNEIKSGLDSDYLQKYRLDMALTSPKIRVESEIDLYPFPQLASDIGGSLGLCLGMSLLTVWRWILLSNTEKPQSTGYHFRHLLYWSVVTILTMITALHGSTSLQEYFNQSPFTAVTPSSTPEKDGCTEYDPIYDQVAARLASRALDCRPGPFSPWEDCVLDCLMNSALLQVGHVAPFVDINDLPPCREPYYWEPSDTYIVPSLAMATATEGRLIKSCRRQCDHLGALNTSERSSPKFLSVDHRFYRIKPYDILCSLGGIVSLYAGLFLSSIITAIVNILPDGSTKLKVFRKCLKFLLESSIYVSGATLSVFLLRRFFFAHPISSSSVSQILRIADQPVLTACHYPPFSSPLDSNLTIDKQWEETAWPTCINRVAITQEMGRLAPKNEGFNVSSVLTSLNKCYSVTTGIPYNNFVTALYYWWNDNDTVIFSIHNKRDPPFASKLFTLRSYSAITLTVTPVHYTRLDQANGLTETYDACLYRCVHDGYSEDVGCRLPYLDWRPDLPLCDSVRARLHPSWPGVHPQYPPAQETNSSCHMDCRHFLREFYLTSTKEEPWIEPGINIIQKRDSYHDIREEDWYELSKLANDLGVVAGFTFGTSILSLLQTLVQRFMA